MPVAAFGNAFHRVTPAGLNRLHGSGTTTVGGAGGGIKTKLLRLLERVPPALDMIQGWNFDRRARVQLAPFVDEDALTHDTSDVVLMLDTFWGGTRSTAAAKRARNAGAMVIPVVHDLIPITHPEYTLPMLVLTFETRLLRALRIATGIIANSRATARDVKMLADRNGLALPIVTFRLGSDLEMGDRHSAPVKATGPFRYLMVGSIDPHKNHVTVLSAFEMLWREGWDGTLTIVGRIGRGDPAFIERLRTHPELGRRLLLLHDASDQRLGEMLDSSDAMVMASRAEGFGIPLVEALTNGMPVIASDIPVFREIAGDSILRFDPEDAADLDRAIKAFETDPGRWRRAADDYRWPTWDASADELMLAIWEIVATTDRG